MMTTTRQKLRLTEGRSDGSAFWLECVSLNVDALPAPLVR